VAVSQTQRRNRRELIALVLLVLLATAGWEAWRGWRQGAQGEAIAQLVRPGDLRLISSTTCVYCDRARAFLQQHQVVFSECFIEQDRACAAEFQARQAAGTPVVLVRGQAQLGFSADRVLAALRPP
jgi:glutaredoxin